MILKNVIIVSSDDGEWIGIYLQDGDQFLLWGEDHQMRTHYWAELINNHHLNEVSQCEVFYQWMDSVGNLLQNFADIPAEAFA